MTTLWQWLEDFWGKIQIPSLLLNILDVVIIAALFYVVFLLIRRTRALQLFQGLAIALLGMLLFSALAGQLGLVTLEWLLRTVVTMLVATLPLVLAIIFQPELRHFFARLGRGGFLGHTSAQARVIDEICAAAESLSEKRIGALIVILRDSGLAELAERGVKLEALVSEEVLISIFEPHSPLHDGAVVIHGNRIEAARVIIPVMEPTPEFKGLGTRHLAASQVSRESDAISLVVSEQTGALALSVGGSLERNLSLSDLRTRLTALCIPPRRERK